MKNFKSILVLENDSEFQGVPRILAEYLKQFDCEIIYWYDFSRDVEVYTESSIKRLKAISSDVYIVCYPMFIGAAFDNYMTLLYTVAKTTSLNIGVVQTDYGDSLEQRLLNYMYDGYNKSKRQRSIEILEKVLTSHNIYSVVTDFEEHKTEYIDFDNIIQYYFETDRKNPDKVKIKESGEVYNVVYVNTFLDDFYLTLNIPDDYNNKYKLNEIERC